jgi:hypothetical protein
MLVETEALIEDFLRVAAIAGFSIKRSEVIHECIRSPHREVRFRKELSAIYIFSLPTPQQVVLKVGKV